MGSDTDSDAAPEAVSLTQSKAGAKERDAAVKRAEAARARERKERNRKRDESLKKRAEETRKSVAKGKSVGKEKKVQKDGDEEERRLLDRMARAMQEAGEESDGSDEEGSWTGLEGGDSDGEESSSSDSEPGPSKPRTTKGHLSIYDEEEAAENKSSDVDEEFSDNLGEQDVDNEEDDGVCEEDGAGDSEDEVQQRPRKKARKLGPEPAEADYLPDHLFTSALSKPLKVPKGKEAKKASSKASPSTVTRKRAKRRGHLSSKDLIVG